MRYGDKAPKSIVARIFSIIWILLGLIIMAIFMASITSALTAVSLQLEPSDLVGVKVCPTESLVLIIYAVMNSNKTGLRKFCFLIANKDSVVSRNFF